MKIESEQQRATLLSFVHADIMVARMRLNEAQCRHMGETRCAQCRKEYSEAVLREYDIKRSPITNP